VTARRATLGRIVDPRDGAAIDEAIATCFHSPHSYTGEDMCEYSLHGNPVIVNALLDCLCAMGARIAEPGEFTLRAFLNGRMDLSQAEAVRDIIDATTLYQAQVAARQISGLIAQEIRPIKELLVEVIVDLESAVEFVEEDLAAAPLESAIEKLEGIRRKLRDWVDSFHRGRLVRDGFSLAVVGKPNVGKSSLFNALLSQNRSIVTAVPGTTRDLVSEVTNIGGIPVRLLDTAGIHDSGSFIERIGMDRSRQAIADADAVLLVGDASKPLSSQDLALKEQLMGLHCFVVINKVDLPSCWSAKEKREFSGEWPCAEVSAKAMDGIEDLRSKILEHFFGATGVEQGGMMVTNLRHCRSLEAAESDLSRATAALRDGLSEEFALTDLYRGLKRFGEITGETGVEDLLTVIFSRFCIGK
jgi:tRNA modification GTPase